MKGKPPKWKIWATRVTKYVNLKKLPSRIAVASDLAIRRMRMR